MINSLVNNKLPQEIRKDQIICEDTKTSSVFEILLLLPDEIIWDILRESIIDNKKIKSLSAGKLIDYSFWPSWDPDNTDNTRRVEPDLFLSFEKLDLIIESKIDLSNKQTKAQWEREIISYKNEHKETKKVILLAVDGIFDPNLTVINEVEVYKTTWDKIADTIINYSKNKNLEPEKKRLFKMFRNIFAMFYISYIDTISPLSEKLPIVIDKNQIRKLPKKWN